MILDTKVLLPKTTLPRYNATKRSWLKPMILQVEPCKFGYSLSFLTKRNTGSFKVNRIIPSEIDFNHMFRCALVAYLCEGTRVDKAGISGTRRTGKNISFANTDPWLIRLVLDQFEKLGIDREDWRVRLELYTHHNIEAEKLWWSRRLRTITNRIKSVRVNLGESDKKHMAPHGRAEIGIESVILGSVLANILNLLKKGKL